MTLTELKTYLRSYTSGDVYYGAPPKKLTRWDYIVFQRSETRVKQRLSLSDTYNIIVIQEDYIPEGHIETMIQWLNNVAGLRVPDQTIRYDYVKKPDSGAVVEMALFSVIVTRKSGGE